MKLANENAAQQKSNEEANVMLMSYSQTLQKMQEKLRDLQQEIQTHSDRHKEKLLEVKRQHQKVLDGLVNKYESEIKLVKDKVAIKMKELLVSPKVSTRPAKKEPRDEIRKESRDDSKKESRVDNRRH